MKKITTICLSAFLIFIVFQLVSCQKIIDQYFPNHPQQPGEVEFQDTVACPISTARAWTVEYDGSETNELGHFYYNSFGKPDSIIFTQHSRSFLTEHRFYYDESGRLKQYDVIGTDYFRPVHRHFYGYKNKTSKRIYSDTLIDSRSDITYTIISVFEYDQKGRITKEIKIKGDTVTGPYPSLDPISYAYDSENNLVLTPDQVETDLYDDKVNFLRTNRLWMFLARNYSLNNVKASETYGHREYNDQGLITVFNETSTNFLSFFILVSAEYQCQ